MKTRIIAFASLVFLTASFFSCRKCTTCSYYIGDSPISTGEVCGSKKDIEEIKTEWKGYETTYNTTVTCTDN
ncbi:MAG: hypothetical protein KJ607_00655 [Bacteroidetes bacterium]|nr:hypothetical protein [Bacteroidota bacterium]